MRAFSSVFGVLALGSCLGLGCTHLTASEPEPEQGTEPDPTAAGVDVPGGECNAVPATTRGLSHTHVDECSPLNYAQNPPAGGDHYSTWAAFQSYSFPVPRGYWVHDLEHGAVVYTYNCPDGCADEVAAVEKLVAELPGDPLCSNTPKPRRVVITPDPLLDSRWGVSSWGFTLRADCVDRDRFTQFYLNHFGHGREQLCAPGWDFAGVPPCE